MEIVHFDWGKHSVESMVCQLALWKFRNNAKISENGSYWAEHIVTSVTCNRIIFPIICQFLFTQRINVCVSIWRGQFQFIPVRLAPTTYTLLYNGICASDFVLTLVFGWLCVFWNRKYGQFTKQQQQRVIFSVWFCLVLRKEWSFLDGFCFHGVV